MYSIFKQIRTKAKKGQIISIRPKTAVKMVIGAGVESGIVEGTIASGTYNAMTGN